MISMATISIDADPYCGAIRIVSEAAYETVSNVTSIQIERKVYGATGGYTAIYEKNISAASDLTFELLDIFTKAGTSYNYNVKIMNGTQTRESQQYTNKQFWMDGLFIGDLQMQYIAGSNFSVTSQRNTRVEYVNTLYGKYPFRVSNADTNYCTGSASGLFLEVTSDGKKFVPDTYNDYSNKVVDFLSDGGSKLLKTHDGQMWYVSIDDVISKKDNEHYMGMNAIEFNWTEIGDIPTYGVVLVA